MCGITILISSNVDAAQVVRANKQIRHRGPDDEGYAFVSAEQVLPAAGADTPLGAFGESTQYRPMMLAEEVRLPANCCLALGHRRLAIVDLSAQGHQPMSYGGGRYWITYNGEVFNHIELREELKALGHTFVSKSDTEVILASYAQWGEDCLQHFNGMWAFAIYDHEKRTLFLARDRFGVKPFYYWAAPSGQLAFGSEIKQFTVLPEWRAKLNPQRAYDFLVWGVTDHTDETLFDRVYQLRPGHSVTLDVQNWNQSIARDGRLPSNAWYTLKPSIFKGSFEEAAQAFQRLLTDAVQLRLRADVPVGSCLSGGLDSSSIVCVMNGLLRQQGAQAQQKTFSACADVARFDERRWIDEVVRATGVDAHYVTPSLENLFVESPDITWHQDEPFGSTSIYAQWNVFRLAAQAGVKVMLDGQGADEQLAGYHGFFSPRLSSLLRGLRWMALGRELVAMRRLHGYSVRRGLMYLARSQLPEGVKNVLRHYFGFVHTTPEWINLKVLGAQPVNPFAQMGADGGEDIQSLSIAMLTASNLQMLLHWEDRDSMAHGVESRVPFLDYRLVEFVVGLPDDYKLLEGITKRVLRAGMSGILPDAIRDRTDKLGFVTPEEVWVREHAPAQFKKKLEDAIKKCHGVLSPQASQLLAEMISGHQAFNFSVWRMISFGEWVERFSVELPLSP